jgi:RNA polymerase sigma-70 factor (ECF subfamily)
MECIHKSLPDGERTSMLEVLGSKLQQRTSADDIAMLAAAARTDSAAFGRLYNHFVQPIYRYLLSRVQISHVAEDLTSQTFMAALEGLPSYRERGYFSAWLFRIARSKLMDYYRRSKYEVSLEAIGERAELDDSLGRVVRDDEIKKLAGLIQKLSAEERDLIQLRYVADLSFGEMAQVLGKREDAVKKSLYRLLASIRSQVE